MTLDEALACVPGWAAARQRRVAPLTGGITNESYRVEVDGERFVLRLGGRDAALLGIDREREWTAVRTAAALGIGAAVAFGAPAEGVLVTRWVEGRALTEADVRRPETLTRLAVMLRRVHAAPPVPGAFSPFRAVEAYREVARRRGVPEPAELGDWLAIARRIETALGPAAPALCHNDLLAANLIESEGTLRLLDWEYAAMGDRFFDLGNLAANAELEPAGEAALLAAYFSAAGGGVPPEAAARLAGMRLASDLREAMWGLAQTGISRLAFDFAGYATRHFARFAARARSLAI